MPCDATAANIMTNIWNKEHWVRAIFDVMQSSICRYQVEGLFLQMIAAKLIGIERRNGKLSWIINKEVSDCAFPPFCYKDDSCWRGMNGIHPNKIRMYPLDQITMDN